MSSEQDPTPCACSITVCGDWTLQIDLSWSAKGVLLHLLGHADGVLSQVAYHQLVLASPDRQELGQALLELQACGVVILTPGLLQQAEHMAHGEGQSMGLRRPEGSQWMN